jgi:hypothetical protein
MCLETPQQETNMACPRPNFLREGSSVTPFGFGRARLATPHPQRGDAGGEKGNLQKRTYTDGMGLPCHKIPNRRDCGS